jgi:hypothetical protein
MLPPAENDLPRLRATVAQDEFPRNDTLDAHYPSEMNAAIDRRLAEKAILPHDRRKQKATS